MKSELKFWMCFSESGPVAGRGQRRPAELGGMAADSQRGVPQTHTAGPHRQGPDRKVRLVLYNISFCL